MRLMRVVAVVRMPDSIDIDGPTIAAGNHQSLLDVFCSAAFCAETNVSCRFLVQSRYFENRIAGRWLRRIGCISTSGDTKDEAFAEAHAALARGELVGIMPEGRLTKPEDRNPQVGLGRPGVSELAHLAGASVRPIVFHNTGVAWPRGGWPRVRFRRPVVTMAFGDPVELTSDDHQVNTDRIMAALTYMLNELDANGDH